MLIQCAECGKDIAMTAKACPHCGHRLHDVSQKVKWLKIIGGGVFIYGILPFVVGEFFWGILLILVGLGAFVYARLLEGQ